MAGFFRALEAHTRYMQHDSWNKIRIQWPGAWGDETIVAFVDSILSFRNSQPTEIESSSQFLQLQDGLSDTCIALGGAVLFKFDERKNAIDDSYGWCIDQNDHGIVRFWYEFNCYSLGANANCLVRVKSVLDHTATDHGRERILDMARSSGMATGDEARRRIAEANARRLEQERAAAEAAAAEQRRHEEEARARAAEQRRITQQRQRLANELRANVALGVETHCGMIIQIRESLVEIQTIAGNKWLRIDQLYAPGTAACQFFNNQYQEPF